LFFRDIEENKSEIKYSEESKADMWNRATNLFRNQRFEESKKLYEKILFFSPENLEAKGQYVRKRYRALKKTEAIISKN